MLHAVESLPSRLAAKAAGRAFDDSQQAAAAMPRQQNADACSPAGARSQEYAHTKQLWRPEVQEKRRRLWWPFGRGDPTAVNPGEE
jgi:hypothetical protein